MRAEEAYAAYYDANDKHIPVLFFPGQVITHVIKNKNTTACQDKIGCKTIKYDL